MRLLGGQAKLVQLEVKEPIAIWANWVSGGSSAMLINPPDASQNAERSQT